MKIKRPKRRRLQDCTLLPLLIVASPIVFIFWASNTMMHNTPNTMLMDSSSTSARQTVNGGIFELQEVPQVDSHVKRFKAVRRRTSHGDNKEDDVVTIDEWIQILMDESDKGEAVSMVTAMKEAMNTAPVFDAFLWETKGTTLESSKKETFEFALVESTYLAAFAATGDPSDFREHLQQCSSSDTSEIACSFENLCGDAMLIAPTPQRQTDYSMYGHLHNFMKGAEDVELVSFWRKVAETYQQRLASEAPTPVWLSTCGTGVAWLHVRLDTRPKYYEYEEFAATGGARRTKET